MMKTLLFVLFLSFAVSAHALSDSTFYRPQLSELLDPNVYPVKSVYGIKSIQTDYWNLNDIVGNGAGGAAVNYPWSAYQPYKKTAPCGSSEVEYDGYCFVVDAHLDSITKQYTDSRLVITGVLIMVPDWARVKNVNCRIVNKVFCSPDNGDDFGRFAGFLASRYNGANGKGRIVDFVIHNEVNSGDWFNVGCGFGIPCDANKWVDIYAASYISAYDRIRTHQPKAPVLISLEHHFDYVYDSYLTATNPFMSGKTFLQKLALKLGSRSWAVAYHSYPPDLLKAEFTQNDLPKITFGNLNLLVGWLMQTFPGTPSAWRVFLTENGINSISPYSSEDKQSNQLCEAFRNIVSTPFIESFVYHRMKDHPDETKDGLGCGLANTDGSYKKAWATWALSNRFDIGSLPKCGFETLPYLLLKRGFKTGVGHWTTTRTLPSGFTLENSYKIFRESRPETRLLYECRSVSSHNFVSVYLNCEQQTHLGPLGYVFVNMQVGTVPLYRCKSRNGNNDHFVSTDAGCEKEIFEELLGYVYL